MPRGDRTGPAGMGPMTGRGAGYCAGYGVPGYANPMGGRGAGRGGGWGYRNWFHATGLPGWQRARMGMPSAYGPAWGAPPPVYQNWGAPWGAYPAPEFTAEQEKDMLSKQVDALEEQIREARKRMEELEEEAKGS
jgi:hypothetical protein